MMWSRLVRDHSGISRTGADTSGPRPPSYREAPVSLSVKVRFEVFKRDRFTCSYCGNHPPDVLLECDHILPRAAGGTDDLTNLTTSCKDCNRGKSDRLLEEGFAPTVSVEHVDELRERLEQAQAYTEVVGGQQRLLDKQGVLVMDVWAKAFGAELIEDKDGAYWHFERGERFPDRASVKTFLRRIPVQEILAAIDITASRFGSSSNDTCLFFYKVCWRRIKGETGPLDGGSDIRDTMEDQVLGLALANERLHDQIRDLEDQLADTRVTIRRFREVTGRDDA